MTIEEIKKQTEGLGILMQPIELFEITKNIHPPMNILIFGLGNDSLFWHETNEGGRTVFFEGKKKWFDDIKSKHPFLEAYKIKYNTKREEWRSIIDKPELLKFDMPPELEEISWNLIIVDGPAGYEDGTPGRMKSIYMASKLIKEGGDIFVHDTQREVEDAYCKRYLLNENLISEVKGYSTLRHYRLKRKTGSFYS
jgi:uncharacterized protein (TIGR01627 family)